MALSHWSTNYGALSNNQFVNHPKTIGTLSDALTLWICSRKAFISANESRDAIEYTNMNPFLGCDKFTELRFRNKNKSFAIYNDPNFRSKLLWLPVLNWSHPILDHFWYINLALLQIDLFQLYPILPMLLAYC